MTAEDIADSYQWESGEADWDSDESFYGQSGEDVEDIGEASRKRRRRPNRYRPGQGVQGIKLQRQDGGSQMVRFPAKLATTAETNRGLASQEMGRRELEEKLSRLEKQYGRQVKNDASVGGFVTLGIGGGLTTFGAVKAAEQPSDKLKSWAQEGATQIASLVSATQLATSGAKLVVDGHYHRSGLGMAADIFAVGQLATFVFASFSSSSNKGSPVIDSLADDFSNAFDNLKNNRYRVGEIVVLNNTGEFLQVVQGPNALTFQRV
jgi:hypothetical protein